MKGYKDVFAFEPMPGRAMKGYVVLPKSVYSDDKLFGEWLDKSIRFVSSLPHKEKEVTKKVSVYPALGYEPKIFTNMAYFSSAFSASLHFCSVLCPSKSR